ncbi:MAG TPA: Rrf2 family transcriptional regulator [Candidatus Polarisedimenticolia bacterium]|nr:Rrf2 family transcriptional regulator [Candidatus Polarisedimenticolia bacterium]
MIRLSKRTDYGLLALRYLALLPDGGYRSAREIAAEYRIPPALLAKLLQRLARRGLVASHHGTKGGYQITRPAATITLGEVIEAIEGPVALTECLHASRGPCAQQENCTVRQPLQAVQKKIAEVLARTTLGDL